MKSTQLLKRAFAKADAKTNPSLIKTRRNWKRPASLPVFLSLILSLASLIASNARAQLASDALHGYGVNGSAQFTASGTGHTGKPGDYAVDLGMTGGTQLTVTDPAFLSAVNAATANDTLSVSLWANLYQISAASGFWFVSPSSPSSERGFQAHLPWSDDNIYFDTAGCCNGGQTRINANINTFAGYTGDDSWWSAWHNFVFIKNGPDKQIWIDGQLFLDGAGTTPLPTDFTTLDVGWGFTAAGSLQGQIDDFAVFGSGLSSNDVNAIFTGTSPTALTDGNLLAYWNFNPTKPIANILSAGPGSMRASPDISFNAELENTASSVQAGTVKLAINGADVTSSAVIAFNPSVNVIEGTTNGAVTVSYISPVFFPAGSTQTVTLVFSDNATPANVYSNTYPIIIEHYNGYVADTVKSYNGFLEGSAFFTPDAGGHTGKAGDRAIDLDLAGNQGDVHVASAGFLNQGSASNTLSFSMWAKLHSVAAGALVFAESPSSNGGERGFAALPWSDDNIYFDTSGCCDASAQRISAAISTLPAYTDDSFWTNWHHYVFLYNKTDKQIWIDGALFLDGSSTDPLPTDFSDLYLGFDVADNAYQQAVIDDVAVFQTAISSNSISMLTNGISPAALTGEKLLAYWNFDSASGGAPLVSDSSTPAPNATGASPDVSASIIILNRATQVQTNSIKLAINGTDVTSTGVITTTPAGATIVLTLPTLLPALSTNTLTVVFSDNSIPPLVQTNTRSFVVEAYKYDSKDSVKSYLGVFQGSTSFTPDAGGRSGKPGDRAINLHSDGTAGVSVTQPAFLAALNAAAGKDMLSVSFWMKLTGLTTSSLVWMNSPSVGRDWNEHVPWTDDNLYFDTAGCCDGMAQRISAGISTFPGYVDDSFWTNWHNFVFLKNLSDKQIWIDGVQFLDGSSTDALTTDINSLTIGNSPGGTSASGWVDDFAIFAEALSTANITQLANGATPSSLGDTNLLAYWAFNDVGPAFLASQSPAPGTTGVAAFGPVSTISATTIDGSTSVKTNSIKLTFNGADVTAQATISSSGGVTTIAYAPAMLPSGSSNTVTLVFGDSGTPANVTSNTWSYTTETFTGTTKDTLHGYLGLFQPASGFTTNGGGHTGQPGDYALDTTLKGGALHIDDATFLHPAETNNTMTFSFWMKRYDITAAGSAFWVNSPSSGGTGFQAYVPYSDDTIYFDTSGCCDTSAQRISAPITGDTNYVDDSFWTNNWHHFVFLYHASDKQIWIDGTLFLDGASTNALALDFTDMYLARDAGSAVNMHGLMDDFAAFSTAVSSNNIVLLSKGTLPTALTGENLLAYWNFNDAAAVGPVLKITGIRLRRQSYHLLDWDWNPARGDRLESQPKLERSSRGDEQSGNGAHRGEQDLVLPRQTITSGR